MSRRAVVLGNNARRQQYRRLWHALATGLWTIGTVALGLLAAGAGATLFGALLLLVAAGLGLRASRWLSLARRSGVGARSENEVQRVLEPLEAEGWRMLHSLTWRGRGDIDSVAIAPTGIAVAIETKTKTYNAGHLARVHEQAAWLARRRRRWSCHGTFAVLCLVRARGVERCEDDVLVLSIDRLIPALRAAVRLGSLDKASMR